MDTFNELLKPEIIWFIIGLVFLLIEFAAPGLIIAFFGIGAWIVAGICLFTDIEITAQLLIFLLSSIILLALFRRYFKKVFKLDSIINLDNDDEFIGHKAICTKSISNNKPGKVELKGAAWKAESSVEINEGDTVKIIDRRSITLIVEPL